MKIFLYIHFAALFMMSFYGLYRLRLALLWRGAKRNEPKHQMSSLEGEHPFVTVQLPVYNERYVVRRLIDSVCAIHWPRDRLEVQVLDDSSDDTSKIIDKTIDKWQSRGVQIHIIRRSHRTGFKAGALENGLKTARGDFIAVFDADFVPNSDFLLEIMPAFNDSKVGLVQARWGFINENASWLTRVQAVLLAAHFGIEQYLRHRLGWMINFNGTAGVWRKEAISSAGGWQPDTVTEDLDLSFRAQLKGWKAVYLDDVEVPSELPVTITALRNQQKRWAKGSMQTARKLLGSIWRSDHLTFMQKFEGTIHLLGNLGWLLGAVIFATLYPTLLQRVGIGPYQLLRMDIPLFLCATLAMLYFFFTSEIYGRQKPLKDVLSVLIFLPAFGLGLAPSIASGVLNGLVKKGGAFLRTPKFGEKALKGLLFNELVYHPGNWTHLFLDMLLLAYSFLPITFAIKRETYFALPFLSIFSFGFVFMVCLDIFEVLGNIRRHTEPA